MSGHSKWSTIKRQKGAKDSARGAVFTKLGNAIAVAARAGTDPDTNFALRLAIDKARAANMPSANIERSINRVKDKDAANLTEVLYEGYGPGGVAILVEAATDNINRTFPDVKVAFSRHGGSIADKGSVAFQFKRVGEITVESVSDDLMLAAIDAGANDVTSDDGETRIYTEVKDLAKVRDSLMNSGYNLKNAELTYEPQTEVSIEDQSTASKIIRLMDALEDIDEVISTHVNFTIPDNLMTD